MFCHILHNTIFCFLNQNEIKKTKTNCARLQSHPHFLHLPLHYSWAQMDQGQLMGLCCCLLALGVAALPGRIRALLVPGCVESASPEEQLLPCLCVLDSSTICGLAKGSRFLHPHCLWPQPADTTSWMLNCTQPCIHPFTQATIRNPLTERNI